MCKTSDGNSLCLLVPSVPRVPSARAGGLHEVGEGGRGLEGILVPILFPSPLLMCLSPFYILVSSAVPATQQNRTAFGYQVHP